MSSPAEPITPPIDPEFDPLAFWIQHRTKILLFTGIFLVAVASYGVAEWTRGKTLAGAQRLLGSAKTADDYRKLIAEYPTTNAAGNAHLFLAEQLRKEGKLDEASALLRTFPDKYPEHPLLSGAWTSLAANLEAQGKADEALATYQKVSTSYGASFSAPIALMAQARLLKANGKTEEAGRIYEQVIARFADNIVAQQATYENRQLKK
jgi:TolA-binding protein